MVQATLFEYETFTSEGDEYDFIVYVRRVADSYRVIVEYEAGAMERFSVSEKTFGLMKKHWKLDGEDEESIMLLDTES